MLVIKAPQARPRPDRDDGNSRLSTGSDMMERMEKTEQDPPYLAQLLADHPGLTREQALEMIREAGG
jgi:hypothetical protein